VSQVQSNRACTRIIIGVTYIPLNTDTNQQAASRTQDSCHEGCTHILVPHGFLGNTVSSEPIPARFRSAIASYCLRSFILHCLDRSNKGNKRHSPFLCFLSIAISIFQKVQNGPVGGGINLSMRETSSMPYVGERFAGHRCNAALQADVKKELNILKFMDLRPGVIQERSRYLVTALSSIGRWP